MPTEYSFSPKTEFRSLALHIFQVSLLSYFFFSLLESLSPGFVSSSISINDIFLIALVSGVTTIFWPAPLHFKSFLRKDLYIFAGLILVAGLVIAYKVR